MAADHKPAATDAEGQPAGKSAKKLAREARRKAAVLIVSLGPTTAAEIFRHMGQEEVDKLVLEIAALDKVTPEEKLAVLEEFYDSSIAQEYVTQGGIGYAKDVLERAMGGERAGEIMNRLTTYIRTVPFEFLRKIDPLQIYNFLQHEHPQTISLVLAYLPSDLSASVLGMMSDDLQAEVATRLAIMDRTAPEILRDVEDVMESKLSSLVNQDLAAAGGVKTLVDILNFVDRSTEGNILASLEERDVELADEVRKLMFVFEDLLILDDKAIQQLLKDVEMKDIALALKGANDEVKAKIMGNMSSRAGQMLAEDMEFMGPVKRRSIEEAQGKIVAIVRRLEEQGKIEIARGGQDEDELVA